MKQSHFTNKTQMTVRRYVVLRPVITSTQLANQLVPSVTNKRGAWCGLAMVGWHESSISLACSRVDRPSLHKTFYFFVYNLLSNKIVPALHNGAQISRCTRLLPATVTIKNDKQIMEGIQSEELDSEHECEYKRFQKRNMIDIARGVNSDMKTTPWSYVA